MTTVTTVGGWATVILVGVGFYWATNQRKNKNKRPLAKQTGTAIEPQKEARSKKARKDGGQSSGDQAVKSGQKKKAKQSTKTEQAFTSDGAAKDTDGDDEVDNREFARQLSNAKTGTLVAPKSQAGSKPKSVKQTQVKERLAETSSDNATAPSSTTGGDADDDQSPINSPNLSATTMASPVTNGVSDMLEKPAAGPSVLRVTSPTNPSQPKKEKMPATFETVETKKQRQNRKKAEAKKLQREEEEKERKVLMEKQRRTAREAEGRAAKDGSAFMAAKAPSAPVWTGSTPAAVKGNTPAPANNFELLDTYEASSSTPAVPQSASEPFPFLTEEEKYSQSQIFGSQVADLAKMSYEEQIEYATEASANWEIVKAKERKTKAAKRAAKEAAQKDNNDPKEDSDSSTDEPLVENRPPTGPGQEWVSDIVYVEKPDDVHKEKMVTKDSEWEVS
jgi:hypothetical protein